MTSDNNLSTAMKIKRNEYISAMFNITRNVLPMKIVYKAACNILHFITYVRNPACDECKILFLIG